MPDHPHPDSARNVPQNNVPQPQVSESARRRAAAAGTATPPTGTAAPTSSPGTTFEDVLASELKDVAARREKIHRDPGARIAPTDARGRALQMDLVGLALSGGGIRSATFALGVLQGLAKLRLLDRIDYLSSVSGGGYIASWLAAWVKRDGDIHNVELQLSPNRVDQGDATRPTVQRLDWRGSDPEPAPIAHLRAYGSYLTPWRGLFTADTWTLLAIYFRNLLINLAIIVPAAAFVALVPRWVVWMYFEGGFNSVPSRFGTPEWMHDYGSWFLAVVMAGCCVLALLPRPRPPVDPEGRPAAGPGGRMDFWFPIVLFVGVLVAAVFLGLSMLGGDEDRAEAVRDLWIAGALLVVLVFWLVLAVRLSLKQRVRPGVWFLARAVVPVSFAALFALWFSQHGEEHTSWVKFSAALGLGVLVAAFLLASWNLIFGPAADPDNGPWFRRFWPGLILPLLLVALLGGWVFGLDPFSEEIAPRDIPQRYPGYEQVHQLKGWTVARIRDRFDLDKDVDLERWFAALLYVVPIAVVAAVLGLASGWSRWGFCHRWTWKLVLANLLAGTGAGLGLFLILSLFVWPYWYRPRLLATFTPPLMLVLLGAVGYIQIAVLGRVLDDQEREWRSRLGGYLWMIGFAWLALFAVTLFLPDLVSQLADSRWGTAANVGAVIAWLGTTFGGAIFSRGPAAAPGMAGILRRMVVRAAPVVFLVGLLGVVSYGLDWFILGDTPEGLVKAGMPLDPARTLRLTRQEVKDIPPEVLIEEMQSRQQAGEPVRFDTTWLVWATFGSFALAAILLGVIDVNVFSLHALYANRLTRCYLGGSRQRHDRSWPGRPIKSTTERIDAAGNATTLERRDDPVTGMDPDDDLPLSDLRMGVATPARSRAGSPHPYYGPLLVVNTTLNVVGGADLALQDRKGISFVLTARHCGSPQTFYAGTPDSGVDDPWNLTLGRAMAISGAAVDPNMSFYQSTSLTAFLTVLNARLGYWIENPKQSSPAEPWRAAGPAFGTFLLCELLGNTDAHGEYVHLSDGGHFENTGAYELVRRRCRYIILCDAGEDPSDASDNLANLIRMCRTDFGVPIEIDTSPLRKGADGLSRWHCAVGRIRYDEVDFNAVAGVLVFLRVSLTGDEPADIRQYARLHPNFPHQKTLDQFFDEAQLESYRGLGYHIANETFSEAADWLLRLNGTDAPWSYQERTRGFFAQVRNRWFPPPPDYTMQDTEATRLSLHLYEALRKEPALGALRDEMYPEAVHAAIAAAGGAEAPTKEILAVNEMLAVMALARMGVHLDGYFAHPLNRGWMDTMHRWTATRAFQEHWPLLRGEYSKDFVRFCEKALSVHEIPPKVVRASRDLAVPLGQAARIMSKAFGLESDPDLLAQLHGGGPIVREDYLLRWILAACEGRPDAPPVWFVTLGKPGQPDVLQTQWHEKDYPVGVLLLRKLPGETDPDPKRLELFFWLRGAQRSLGLGRGTLLALRQCIRAEYGDRELVVRYPIAGTTSGDRLQRALWMNFFHDFNFRQERPAGPGDLLIELVWRPPPLAPVPAVPAVAGGS